jgi:hypothetical protein
LKKALKWFFRVVLLVVLAFTLNIQTIKTNNSTMEFRYTSETTNPLFRVVTINKVLEEVERITYFRWIDLVVIEYQNGYFIAQRNQFKNVDIENIWS